MVEMKPNVRSRRAIARHSRNAIAFAKAARDIAGADHPDVKRAERAARRAVNLARKALRGMRIARRTPASTVVWGAERTAHYAWSDVVGRVAFGRVPNPLVQYGRTHGSALGDRGW